MGSEYGPAIDMFVDESRTFIDALAGINHADLSIVIHGTGSPLNADGSVVTAQQCAHFFAIDPNRASTHFIVGRDGTVVQCVRLKDGAGGNCCLEPGHDAYWDSYASKYSNLNFCTFSIEHCNDVTNGLAPTPAQLAASIKLVQWLCIKYGIPANHIKTHASLDPVDRAHCPGNYPMNTLIGAISNVTTSAIAQAAQATWNSTKNLNGGVPFRADSGIALAWFAKYEEGNDMPAPATDEFPVNDWAGNEGVGQGFLGGVWAFHSNGVTTFYKKWTP